MEATSSRISNAQSSTWLKSTVLFDKIYMTQNMTTPINLDLIVTYTGKLNKLEKSKANAGLQEGKSLGSILDEIAISRSQNFIGIKLQDQKNSKIKNHCSSKVQLDLKKDSQTNQLNYFEQKELQKEKIRQQTNNFINLQQSKRKKFKNSKIQK